MEEKSFELKRMHKRYIDFSPNFFILMEFSMAAYLKNYLINLFLFCF